MKYTNMLYNVVTQQYYLLAEISEGPQDFVRHLSRRLTMSEILQWIDSWETEFEDIEMSTIIARGSELAGLDFTHECNTRLYSRGYRIIGWRGGPLADWQEAMHQEYLDAVDNPTKDFPTLSFAHMMAELVAS